MFSLVVRKVGLVDGKVVVRSCVLYKPPLVAKIQLVRRLIGRAAHNVVGQALRVFIAHLAVTLSGKIDDLVGVVCCRPISFQNVDVEGSKSWIVKAHAGATMRQAPGQIGSCPIQNGHEIVAGRLNATASGISQVLQTDLVIGNVFAPVALLFLDIFGNRQAFHHLPCQA